MKYDAAVNRAIAHWSPRYGVRIDSSLVHAMIERETRHGAAGLVGKEPDGDHSYGPMQVKGATASSMLGVNDPWLLAQNPDLGVWYGVQYLAMQLKRFGGNTRKAVSAYNAGPGNVKAGRPLVNPAYVNAVMAFWHSYRGAAMTALLPLLALGGVLLFAMQRRR